MLRDHDYDPVVQDTLGHAAAATGLVAQSLKFDGSVTLQIQGDGELRMLVMQCTSELEVRGMATSDAHVNARSFAELVRNAHCAITVDSGERPYQGIVAIEGTSLAASLENYFARSAQVPSHVVLVCDDALCGGLLLQQTPGQTQIEEDDWNRLGFMAATLKTEDLQTSTGIELVGKLFAEDDVRVFRPRPVHFHCRCSRARAEEVLRMLGEDDNQATVAEQGSVEVTCEYCGHRRLFDAIDISRLFAENAMAGPERAQ